MPLQTKSFNLEHFTHIQSFADMVEDPVHLPGPIRNLLPILHAPRFPGILALCGRKLDKFHAINP